eukprot:Gb_21413 [translate_table: standard]
MAMEEDGPLKKKRARLIARLGALLVLYANQVSILCCLAGLVTLLLLPVLAKNTYISENALMPGSANPRFSNHDALQANKLVKEILNLKREQPQNNITVQGLLMRHMLETGADVYLHKFLPPDNTFEPLCFLTNPSLKVKAYKSNSSVGLGVNVIGITRAAHGDGKEAIVLVTPFQSENIRIGDALSLGLGFSIFRLLSRTVWLAKDIVWLAADSQYGTYAAVAAWLRDYHEPVFYGSSDSLKSYIAGDDQHAEEKKGLSYKLNDYNKLEDFQRAGTIAAAVVFQVQESQSKTGKDYLNVYAEASNGQMPNLDLINTVNYLAVHRQGLQMRVESIVSMLSWRWLTIVGGILEWLGKFFGSLSPEWKFGLPALEYVQGSAILASSVYHQALGIPTGAHGAFRDYQVDAITLEMSPSVSLESESARASYILKLGRLLEGVVRSVNNLLEKFHQSFFLYFLTSSGRFISVGVYMIPFVLLIIPLPVLAAALWSYKNITLPPLSKSDDKSIPFGRDEPEATDSGPLKSVAASDNSLGQDLNVVKLRLSLDSWTWIDAGKVVLLVHLWAAIVGMLPCMIHRSSAQTSEIKLLIWAILSCLSLFVVYGILGRPYLRLGMQQDTAKQCHMEGWVALKSFTLGTTTIGLGIMSVVNFAASLLGAIILVPMCLSVYPLKYMLKMSTMRRILLMFVSTSLTLLAFPPLMVVAIKGLSDGFSKDSFTEIWNWTEILWFWGSATYPYLLLVHLPCWVLCFHVLLYI